MRPTRVTAPYADRAPIFPTRIPLQSGGAGLTRADVDRVLGPVVYFARTPDGLIKIGRTKHLGDLASLGLDPSSLLVFVQGGPAEERAWNERLHANHARWKLFYPHPTVIAVVNELRAEVGLPPVEV